MTIDELLEQARAALDRVDAHQLVGELANGALVIDMRPAAQRQAIGHIPGSIVIERNVLEWRLDPVGEFRIEAVTGYDQRIVLVCQEGYASSLAALTLRQMGLHRVTDLIDGVEGWIAEGLPTVADAPVVS